MDQKGVARRRLKLARGCEKKMGKPTVKWSEDEENDSCGPKEARWRYKTKEQSRMHICYNESP